MLGGQTGQLLGEDDRALVAVGVKSTMRPVPCASAVRVIDMTGVMPLPPASSSRSALSEAGVKMPLGGSTRIESPLAGGGRTPSSTHTLGGALDRDGERTAPIGLLDSE